jgi:hypothetical protein
MGSVDTGMFLVSATGKDTNIRVAAFQRIDVVMKLTVITMTGLQCLWSFLTMVPWTVMVGFVHFGRLLVGVSTYG